jgi:23S rRNA (guanosine2251-2'-O)-methyltransferase
MRSPRLRHLTVPGRKPVLEALADPSVPVRVVHLSPRATGAVVDEIRGLARRRGVPIEDADERRLTELARSSRQHQGVVADVEAAAQRDLADFLAGRRGRAHATSVLVLDGVHNPANVGMILRSAVGLGLDGIVVPDRGTASVGPVAIKASAGVAFRAPILRCVDAAGAVAALAEARFAVLGLDVGGECLFDADLPERAAYVVGNETDGLTVDVDRVLTIPIVDDVESLNVAVAASVLCAELARRRHRPG